MHRYANSVDRQNHQETEDAQNTGNMLLPLKIALEIQRMK